MRRGAWTTGWILGLIGAAALLLAGGPGAQEPPESIPCASWYRGGENIVFDHALHSAVESDCARCHHLERCSACHLQEGSTQVVSDGKTARHAVCFQCHTQAPGGGDCAICHAPPAAGAPLTGVAASPRREGDAQERRAVEADWAAAMLPPAGMTGPGAPGSPPAPARATLATPEYADASVVLFDHAAHATARGLACAACHHLEGCGRCHADLQKGIATAGAADAFHARCVECHENSRGPTGCDECHVTPAR